MWGQRQTSTLRADVGDPAERALQAKCLVTAGLPTNLYEEATAHQTTHDEWMAENSEAIRRLGAFGTPTIALAGSDIGVSGPVVDPVPSGADALALWDSVYVALQASSLYEMKRTRPRRSNIQFAD
jgi:hypothetical protein